MEDGNVYVYDFSELREEVKAIETQVSELVSLQSDQASEMVSVMSNTVEYTSLIKQHTEIEVVLLIAVIVFCGFISGLLIVNLTRK